MNIKKAVLGKRTALIVFCGGKKRWFNDEILDYSSQIRLT